MPLTRVWTLRAYLKKFLCRIIQWQYFIKENTYDHNKFIRVYAGANTTPFSPMTLAYVTTQKKIKSGFAGYATKVEEIIYFDFVIVKSG